VPQILTSKYYSTEFIANAGFFTQINWNPQQPLKIRRQKTRILDKSPVRKKLNKKSGLISLLPDKKSEKTKYSITLSLIIILYYNKYI